MKFKIALKLLLLLNFTLLFACGGGGSAARDDGGNGANTTPAPDDSLEDIRPVLESTYSDVIKGCALADTTAELCTLSTLPLLGMEAENPSINDIMTRVLVSHDWMGTRFEALLAEYPPSMLQLFKGLTAIVIDDDIRPAHYRSETGAIYLDPFYLWTNNEEKITINPKEDYRSSYSDPLSFRAWGRYLKNGDYAFSYGALDDEEPRSMQDTVLISARLLIHELAHVNDFLPPSSYDNINRNYLVLQAIQSLVDGRLSDRLSEYSPLHSDLLEDLAKVMFHGTTASFTQKYMTATEVGEEFETDAAADAYSYSNQFEDLAMLFEVILMKYYWDLDYQVAFVEPTGAEYYCDDYIIGWGAYGWIGDTDVKNRALFVTNELTPELDLSMFYQELAAPQLNQSGSNWCIASTSAGLSKPNNVSQRMPINPRDFERRPH
ncbi:hypothetical protein [Teredinibacter haidensis]|uniref:hypothetical protein n=1 Tax=Teredinibacter haidensis TaxID=2731755 RepID=UPI000948EF79|nr:hypothetical protein [Teredinibacter haidensis]